MKSQTALEYLMTYGWAILIVIIAIGTLYALGLTKTCRWFTRTTEFADFRVEHAKLTASYLSFDLSYLKYNTIKLHDLSITGDASSQAGNPFAGTVITSTPILLAEATSTSKAETDCYNIEVAIKYNITTSRGAETFTTIGKISGVVERHTEPENIYICTNAQSAGLCNGLDFVYGSGYKAACCTNYGLCCG